jgi:hypothetical protein
LCWPRRRHLWADRVLLVARSASAMIFDRSRRKAFPRALAAKGVVDRDRRTFKVTRTRMVQFLSKLDARGITQKVGQGNAARQEIALDAAPVV